MLENVDVLIHSCIRIEGKAPSVVIYFDPFSLSVEPHDADVIFVTHDHYDHFSPEDIVRVARADTILVVPETCKNAVLDADWPEERLVTFEPGDVGEVCGVPVEAVAAYNVGKKFHPRDKRWLGYIVTIDDVRYYVAGDTDANDENRAVVCDVALVPVGATYTFDAAEAAAFVNELKPKAAVPTHYGSAVGEAGDGAKFAQDVNPEITVELKL